MKCIVPVKRVIDYNVKIRVKADGSGVETNHVKMSMNPFDEVALEEALRLKEAKIVTDIIAVSIGTTAVEETLRVAYARGADKAILIESNTPQEPLSIAKFLKLIVEKEGASLVIMGKQAIDDDCNQTGQMLAGLLRWSQATNVSKLVFNSASSSENAANLASNTLDATREIDGGLETLTLKLPAVITVDLRLNDPRYISLPNVMRAKNKPITNFKANELGLSLKTHTTILKVEPPMLRRSGVILNNVSELVDKLQNEAKLI